MTQPFRLATGGLIDRSQLLRFKFDGRSYAGYAGDTLASALLANGVHLIGRSFKYHRPRGIYSCGAEEPNALVQIGRGATSEPNVNATTLALHEGLIAEIQNCWPSVRFDLGAVNNVISALIPSGFYYKTFMWPPSPRWWLRYEQVIRNAAGMGRAAELADEARYRHQYAHCDVFVIGGGVAGLAAARASAAAGARVVLCDNNLGWGGTLRGSDAVIDERPAADWISAAAAELASNPRVKLMLGTSVFGYYDDNLMGAIEQCNVLGGTRTPAAPELSMWKIRARRVILAGGALERGITYPNNDRPGTLLAGAARAYLQRFGVAPGRCAVVFTNNDDGHAAALALFEAKVRIAAIVDPRPASMLLRSANATAAAASLPILSNSVVTNTYGTIHVTGVEVEQISTGTRRRIECDLVCVSGGWNPTVHLFSQAQGRLKYDESLATFVPDISPLPIFPVGAARGTFQLTDILSEAHARGIEVAAHCGHTATTLPPSVAEPVDGQAPLQPLWSVKRGTGARSFVDLQCDVTAADVALAAREGYRAVEHLKRYTTLGMGTDQGKTSNVIGLALLAEALAVPIPDVGTTTFRPPYVPITLGAVAGPAKGQHIQPTRYSPMHDWHVEHGACFITTGLWKRPHSYPRAGESTDDAAAREARNVRQNVGLADVSTLGKIELQGPDAVVLLNRMYVNKWDTLGVGRCRYGLMLRDDGMVMDDGTVSRLAEHHFLITTTSVNAVKVMQHIEFLIQIEWPELAVYAASVTEQWAAVALAGPHARDVLASVIDIDLSNSAFPFLAMGLCCVDSASGPIGARIFRMSFSGENAYEVHVPADRGLLLWQSLLEAGEGHGIMPYGTEAMATLRIEKGHIVVGAEADGRTTPADLDMAGLVSRDKWCLGKPLLHRLALNEPMRWQLVGLTALEGAVIPRAAKLVVEPDCESPVPMSGHVTSVCYSPTLGRWIALALVSGGRTRHGETLWAISPLLGQRARVSIGPPCFIDPDGTRYRS